MFEFVEKALYEMPFFVKPPVAFALIDPVGFGRDGMPGVLIFNIDQKFIRIIPAIPQNHASGNVKMRKHIYCHAAIVDVALRKLQIYWISKTIDHRMDFYVLSAATGTYFPISFVSDSPFFAPAAC